MHGKPEMQIPTTPTMYSYINYAHVAQQHISLLTLSQLYRYVSLPSREKIVYVLTEPTIHTILLPIS